MATEPDIARRIAKKIHAARIVRNLSQKECAARGKFAQSSWCEWENGTSAPKTKHLPAIARILGIPLESLLSSPARLTTRRRANKREPDHRSAKELPTTIADDAPRAVDA
jgi:transcriptional regulator with XRE-family HTH domain